MQITLTILHPQEADYACRMFAVLEDAMRDNPVPLATARDISNEISQTEFGNDVVGTTEDAQPAGDNKPAGAGKRGRKSNAEKEALAAAAALRPGDLLKGASAQSLQQALSGMPLVHSEEGLEVRVAPGTPVDEIAAMKVRIEADMAKTAAPTADPAPAAKASATEDFLSNLTGSAPAATPPVATMMTSSVLTTPPAVVNQVDDLASLFKKKDAPPAAAASMYSSMNHEQLLAAFIAMATGNGGLPWAKRVAEAHKVDSLDDLTREAFIGALENPKQYAVTLTTVT
jgi:hypothetical protein